MPPIALPPVLTPQLLNYIRKHPSVPPHTWYFISAAVLAILNRPDEITTVYERAIQIDSLPGGQTAEHEERLKISRRIREALIKSSAVGGVPKTINALLALKEVTPIELQDEVSEFSPTSRRIEIYHTPMPEILTRGQTFFENIYGKISKRVMGQMERSGTEDLGLIARLTYSYILSNTSVLSPAETSYVMIAGLIPQDVNPQLKGHLRGALNGGATKDEVKAVRDIVIRICEASGMRMIDSSVPAGWGWREEVADL
ncbi:AhpD-like protein [Halenospora varia]|nr:AhpD-like protein [Halenospora varia]